MSPNTPLSGRDRSAAWRSFAIACVCVAGLGVGTAARALTVPPLPQEVTEIAPGLKLQGGAELRFFGIAIYDGWYWSTQPGWSLDHVFALDLQYLRSLDGDKIAARSVEEIARLGYGNVERRLRWGDEMKRVFPDVKKGDSLTGLYVPGSPVRFFHNGKPLGDIADPGFAEAFFAIWFDPKTSRSDVRKKLLGIK